MNEIYFRSQQTNNTHIFQIQTNLWLILPVYYWHEHLYNEAVITTIYVDTSESLASCKKENDLVQ